MRHVMHRYTMIVLTAIQTAFQKPFRSWRSFGDTRRSNHVMLYHDDIYRASYPLAHLFSTTVDTEDKLQSTFTTMKLISATPSPYARKVRITLKEKDIPFDLQTEVPWDSTTKTPEHNPLEKLPVLILDDGTSIYESHHILEWLEVKYPPPKHYGIYPRTKDDELLAKQVQVVADGMCDACVLLVWEAMRESDKQSEPWKQRQGRKLWGGLKALSDWVGDKEFIIEDRLTLADISAASVLGFMKLRMTDYDWETKYPNLKKYCEKLEQRESFASTKPTRQTYKDKIV